MASVFGDPDEWYRLRAYVCDEGYVQWVSTDAWVHFVNIYVGRPQSCRYAVAGTHAGDYVAWDLFDAWQDRYGAVLAPPPIIYPTVEAAVMATVLKGRR